LTYHCSAQCDHCHLRAGLEQSPAIDYDLARTTIADLQRVNGLSYVVLLGGEPGLYPALTHDLAAAIHELGMGVRIETNASWAVDEAAARAFLAPLCAVGAQIMLSVDAFHEPYVNLDRVERAMRMLDRLGGEYILEVPYLDYPEGRNPLDARTNRLLGELDARLG
jgi:MoaA/NifB/PqqE/SkfB family radical SAM enzyme